MNRMIYCLCNYIGKPILDSVTLVEPMKCIKTGAKYLLEDGSTHYPNVDVFECPSCGAGVAK